MTRLVLINPNTNGAVTAAMAALAGAALPVGATLESMTAPFGSPLITDEAQLAVATEAVLALAPSLRARADDGIIVAAFGDPGLSALRLAVDVPVTGIAEAGMAEAAAGDRVFVVVTTTPRLQGAIDARAARYGHGSLYRGCVVTPGDPRDIMNDPTRLVEALASACAIAVGEFGAEAIVIGGGPLATAARTLSGTVGVPLIEPVPAAARLALRRACGDRARKAPAVS